MQQCIERTGTNPSRAWFENVSEDRLVGASSFFCKVLKVWEDVQLDQDFCGGRKERPASAAKAYWGMSSKRDAVLTKREHKKTVQRSGDDGWEVPPVPIPNTAVKLSRVESTWLEAAREDRLLPVTKEAPAHYVRGLFLFIIPEEGLQNRSRKWNKKNVKTLYRRVIIMYNNLALKLNNRQFVTILSLNKTTGAIE